jgi:hypothetical protein
MINSCAFDHKPSSLYAWIISPLVGLIFDEYPFLAWLTEELIKISEEENERKLGAATEGAARMRGGCGVAPKCARRRKRLQRPSCRWEWHCCSGGQVRRAAWDDWPGATNGVVGGSGCGPRPWAAWVRCVMLGGRVGRWRRRGTWMAACRRERASPEDYEKGRRRPTLAPLLDSLSSLCAGFWGNED